VTCSARIAREARCRVGRPLPWPDYSRGSISYSLEDVKIDSLGNLTAADRLGLTGLDFGRKVRTSTMTTSFLRNSADHPLYPTHGTKLSITSELAGGLFGGGTNFHKHRLEERVYLPSFMKPHDHHAARRARRCSAPTRPARAVPHYERFRLGGGTTPDPLRGYDDYRWCRTRFRLHSESHRSGHSGVGHTFTRRTTGPLSGWPLSWTLFTVNSSFPLSIRSTVCSSSTPATRGTVAARSDRSTQDRRGVGFRMEIPLLGVIGFDYGTDSTATTAARGGTLPDRPDILLDERGMNGAPAADVVRSHRAAPAASRSPAAGPPPPPT
jgi:hypothetical protein